jgi:Ser-tRNA(Ala) deacylase AlaX
MIFETELAYLKDAYVYEMAAEVLSISNDEQGHTILALDSTIFYPESGGQPSDTGTITGDHGSAQVLHARYMQGVVLHQCNIEGYFQEGEAVRLRIDWGARYRHMRAHTAGHVLHDALMQLPHPQNLFPVKGNHKKLYVEYSGDVLPPELAGDLESACNAIIAANLETHSRFVDLQELRHICEFVPPNLPTDKPLRVLWIEGYSPFPCGGTHVKRTGEIRPMKILHIGPKKGVNRIRYQIEDAPQ